MKNHWQLTTIITTLVVLPVWSDINYSVKLLAQPTISESTSIQFTPPPPPPDRGVAGDRGEAASRGCGNGEQSLMALVPRYQQTIEIEEEETIDVTKIWALTTSAYPTFWFFIPYEKSSIVTMEFVLKDESQQPSQTIYRNFLNKPEAPGIISVSTNTGNAPLEISQEQQKRIYHWFLKVKIQCNPQQPAELHFVEGWIERTNLNSDLADNLEQLTPLQQAAIYAENGIWHNALTTLAKLHLQENYLSQWTSLLQDVDLENLANYPLVNCCESN